MAAMPFTVTALHGSTSFALGRHDVWLADGYQNVLRSSAAIQIGPRGAGTCLPRCHSWQRGQAALA